MANSADDVQISQLNETMEMIINFVPNLFLVKDDDDEEEDGVQQKVDELRQTLAQLIKQERHYKNSMLAVREAQTQVDSAITKGAFDVKVERVFEDTRKQIVDADKGAYDVNDHPKMKKFERAIASNLHNTGADDDGNDDDVTTLMTNCSIVDPITKQTMKDPVKNTNCGHSYDRSTILSLISQQKLRCPMPGCPNQLPIHKNHLVDNVQLKKYIQHTTQGRI